MKKNLLSFEEARTYVHSLQLKNINEWYNYRINRAENLPYSPDKTYKDKWISWSDWLGNGTISVKEKGKQFLSYIDAKEYMKQFGFQSEVEFFKWCKDGNRPDFIPTHPHKFYHNELNKTGELFSISEFLGYDKLNVSFPERVIESFLVHNNINYKCQYKFKDCKLKRELPFDFAILDNVNNILGCIEYHGRQHNESVNVLGGHTGFKNIKKSDDIKKVFCENNNLPLLIIQNETLNKTKICKQVSQFLLKFDMFYNSNLDFDFNMIDKTYMSFLELRTYIHTLHFKNREEYYKWWRANKPNNIPAKAYHYYTKTGEWTNWKDFLGNDFVSYEDAQKWGKEQGLKNSTEWRNYKNRPSDIPSEPEYVYKEQWNGWTAFLGGKFVSYEEARKWAKENGIRGKNDWFNRIKPSNIPSNPQHTYKEQWNGWFSFYN